MRTKNKHVCILTSFHSPFDTRIFHKQAKSIASAGYQTTLLVPSDEVDSAVVQNIHIIRIKKFSSRWQLPLTWSRLLRQALKANADIYHFHDPDLLLLGVLLKRLTSAVVIYDCHEFYAENLLTRQWLPQAIRPSISKLFAVFESRLASYLDAVVLVNDAQKKLFMTAKRTEVISNYVDKELFHASNIARQNTIILMGSRLSLKHGVDLVIYAFGAIAAEFPDAKLHLIGEINIPETDKCKLDEWISQKQLSNRVFFLGRIPTEQVREQLAKALIGVIPFQDHLTLLNVPTPIRLFEYMAEGVAVAASNNGFLDEVILDADCGILVNDYHCVDAWTDAFRQLLSTPERTMSYGKHGSDAVEMKYNWQLMANKLLAMYDELIG